MRKKVSMVVLSVIFGLLMNTVLVYAEFYKWIDDQGNFHFTDQYSNIPDKYRPFVETRKTPIESFLPNIKKEPTAELTPESSEPVEQERSLVFRGVISQIDKAARTIVVTGTVKTMVFPVPEDTTIKTVFGRHILFTELRTEMSVSVEHIPKDEDIRTLSIKIETMPSGFENIQRLEEKDEAAKYEGPKYKGVKYEGVKYEGPKYEAPKYKAPKK